MGLAGRRLPTSLLEADHAGIGGEHEVLAQMTVSKQAPNAGRVGHLRDMPGKCCFIDAVIGPHPATTTRRPGARPWLLSRTVAGASPKTPGGLKQKPFGRDDFSKIPNGAPGIEARMTVVYDGGVRPGLISLNRFAELTATAPAKIFGLYPQKRTIAVGSDAGRLAASRMERCRKGNTTFTKKPG